MLLALLMLVGGLEGGADGGPEGGPEKDRIIVCCGASASGSPTDGEGRTAGEGGCERLLNVGGLEDGMGGIDVAVGRGGTGGVEVEAGRGGGGPLTALEAGPLGGGGVAVAAGVASGFFLSIHLFFSGS